MQREIFLAFIVSIDTYLAAAAYCNSGIRIPAFSAAIINLIGAAVLGISLKFSELLGSFIPVDICHIAGIAVLIFIGLLTIMKSLIRTLIRRISERGELSLKMGKNPIVVKLYLDETAADFDNSKILSAVEAAALALASSFDSAAMGLSSGFDDIRPFITSVFAFLCGFLAIFVGNLTGRKISSLRHDFSWVGGVMLILFAFFS